MRNKPQARGPEHEDRIAAHIARVEADLTPACLACGATNTLLTKHGVGLCECGGETAPFWKLAAKKKN